MDALKTRLAEVLAAYGADPARWPAAERDRPSRGRQLMADPADTQTPLSRFANWPHWTKFLLVASLAVNLLIAGAAGMRYFYPERMERWSGASFTQLLPRKFMSDLPDARRREFLDLLKSQRGTFRESRADMRDAALRFAEALERNPYDEAQAATAVQDFTKLSTQ